MSLISKYDYLYEITVDDILRTLEVCNSVKITNKDELEKHLLQELDQYYREHCQLVEVFR